MQNFKAPFIKYEKNIYLRKLQIIQKKPQNTNEKI